MRILPSSSAQIINTEIGGSELLNIIINNLSFKLHITEINWIGSEIELDKRLPRLELIF